MSENKLKSRNAIDAELRKTKAELIIATSSLTGCSKDEILDQCNKFIDDCGE
jgi:hypothetical protein